MMLKNRFKKIIVVSPSNVKTGGVELLHQLVKTLNQKGIDASIAYTGIEGKNEIQSSYLEYTDKCIRFEDINDDKESLIIISEHQVELIDLIKKSEVAVWWLSVDNYYKVYNPLWAWKLIGIKGVLWYIKHFRWRYSVSKIKERIKYNFAQSYYAIDFLKTNGFQNIAYLSDYINDDYLNVELDDNKNRDNVVLYNPKKGIKYTTYLIEKWENIVWVPLINMTKEEVKSKLLNSKVYIDFGNHPGKDRFPREAAVCGCCIITSKNGSANYFEDVPIDNEYKFEDTKQNSEKIIKCIEDCLYNYENNCKKFDSYREKIKKEKTEFEIDVDNIFKN